jgi:uncharacterized protein (DUF2252 family)
VHQAEEGRDESLIGERRDRMAATPWQFFRGAANLMAADLVRVPVTGVDHQICGDAHAGNFGLYISPEREVVFDLNDFDESRRGPWEWDVARLAASVAVVARSNGHRKAQQRGAAQRAVRAFRERLRDLAGTGLIAPWIEVTRLDEAIDAMPTAGDRKLARQIVAAASRRTSVRALRRFVRVVDGVPQIRDRPKQSGPIEGALATNIRGAVKRYRTTLPDGLASVLGGYDAVAVGFKIVGVGSVGRRDYVVVLEGITDDDVLVLQVKEAGPSLLDPYLPNPAGAAEHQGRRVVDGQHLMQAVSDPLLGWTSLQGRDFYVRHYRDVKGSIDLDQITPAALELYAALCGSALARAHGRAGQPALLSAYLGGSDAFDRAVAAFAMAYADQTWGDHAAFAASL